ncbi:hypothetical protein ACF0H5_000643 [Mactra antiquata]
MKGALFIIVVAVSVCGISAIQTEHSFEFEDVITPNNSQFWVWRSGASNVRTLRLVDEKGIARISLQLCIQSLIQSRPVNMNITNITYTNDGPKDYVMMNLNGVSIANWTTYERCGSGFEWNVPKYSGQLVDSLPLVSGIYNLTISVNTDEYGMEFDKIDVTLDNQRPDTELFCGASLYFVDE